MIRYYKGESEYIINLINKYCAKIINILDVGCGTGKHASLFATNGFNVKGIDLSSDMIEIAKENKLDNCNFYQADTEIKVIELGVPRHHFEKNVIDVNL